MQIRFVKPKLCHVQQMQKLVYFEVENGIILERSSDEIATHIRSYTLVYIENELVGFAALHIHTIELAEIRSLIIKEGFRGEKIGEKLVNYILEEGIALGLKRVLSLTYKQSFFERLGFVEIPKESLPQHKIWADCIKCKHFPICDEVSLIKEL
ncbi:N-acetylglutamate synthase [hydrothermal vent metagenome]|uniref:N-acetylglutamate synthase n=1 Tax=hydrothermal vent metagenome TaxID=652676 RepID=A0A1W1CSP7_9ZZZZ